MKVKEIKTTNRRCKAITKFGRQCVRHVVVGDYCTLHYLKNGKKNQKI